jgi:hypothetical protein
MSLQEQWITSQMFVFLRNWTHDRAYLRILDGYIHVMIANEVMDSDKYEGHSKSSWTHLITPNWNFVEVRWRSVFRSTSPGKRCTSYNAPPTSRKRAADNWSLRNSLPRSSVFRVGKAQKSQGARSELYGGCCIVVPPIHLFQAEQHRIQFRSHPLRYLGFYNHKNGAPRQAISKWSTVCSTLSRSGWSVVRSAPLPKGGTLKTHKVPTRSNKVSSRTFLTAIVYARTNLLSNGYWGLFPCRFGGRGLKLTSHPI